MVRGEVPGQHQGLLRLIDPLEDRGMRMTILQFFKARLDIMDREKTYVIYCKVGVRSKVAIRKRDRSIIPHV